MAIAGGDWGGCSRGITEIAKQPQPQPQPQPTARRTGETSNLVLSIRALKFAIVILAFSFLAAAFAIEVPLSR